MWKRLNGVVLLQQRNCTDRHNKQQRHHGLYCHQKICLHSWFITVALVMYPTFLDSELWIYFWKTLPEQAFCSLDNKWLAHILSFTTRSERIWSPKTAFYVVHEKKYFAWKMLIVTMFQTSFGCLWEKIHFVSVDFQKEWTAKIGHQTRLQVTRKTEMVKTTTTMLTGLNTRRRGT